MASNTPNINLVKPTLNEFYDLGVVNGNSDKIDTAVGSNTTEIAKSRAEKGFYTVDSGSSANSKLITMPGVTSYTTNLKFAFRNTSANTNTSVNIRLNGMAGRVLYRADGSSIPVGYLKANTIYHVIYDGTAFFLLGDSFQAGTAQAPQVLSGYTFATDNGLANGSIPIKSAELYIPDTIQKVIPSGQYLGGNQVIQGDLQLRNANIRSGATIFGVNGTFTDDATVEPSDVKSLRSFYAQGEKKIGTAPIIQGRTIIPGTTPVNLAEGSFLDGMVTVLGDPAFQATNIRGGVSIFDLVGTGPNFSRGSNGTLSNADVDFEEATTNGLVTYQARLGQVSGLPFVPKVFIAISKTTYLGAKPTTIYIEGARFVGGVNSPILATGTNLGTKKTYATEINANVEIGTTMKVPMLHPVGATNLEFDWFAFSY